MAVVVLDHRLEGMTNWAILCRRQKTLSRWRLRQAVRAIRLAAANFPDEDGQFTAAVEALLRRKR